MTPTARRPWAVGALVVLAVPALLPLLSAALAWATPAGEIWAHQLQYVLPRVTVNTLACVITPPRGVPWSETRRNWSPWTPGMP